MCSFLLTQSVISLLRVERSVWSSGGLTAGSPAGLLSPQINFPRLLFISEKRSVRLDYALLCSCTSCFLVLQPHMALPIVFGSICEKSLRCKAAIKETEPTCCRSFVERLFAQGSRPTHPSAPLLASVPCVACDCGDAWMRSTHLVSSDFMDLHAFSHKHERAFSKGFPFSLFLLPPPLPGAGKFFLFFLKKKAVF